MDSVHAWRLLGDGAWYATGGGVAVTGCPRKHGSVEPVVSGPHGFPRQSRLTKRAEYLRAFREGDRRVGRAFICYVARRNTPGKKLGCVVSRRVGSAVVRNRVKRYLREFFRTHREKLAPDVDVVVVARPDAAFLDYHACAAALRNLFLTKERN